MARASNGGFRHPSMHGAMGLFGSQGRPGMTASSSLGSLGGNTLGIPDGAISRYGMGADEPAPTVAAPSVTAAAAPMTTKTKLMIAAGLVGAYFMFFKNKRTLTRNPSGKKRRTRRKYGPRGTLKLTAFEQRRHVIAARSRYLARKK